MNPNSSINMSPWQTRQAAMLYYFASLEYLRELHAIVSHFIGGVVDPLLDLAKSQNRDSVLIDPIWGTRNTSENWANNAWPSLRDFQASLTRDIASRSIDRFAVTGVNDCLRALDEYSMQWITPTEEQTFRNGIMKIGTFARKIDDTLDTYHNSKWDDFSLTEEFREFSTKHRKIPRFRARTDVEGESGIVPIRSGVYMAQNDPNASLQFAWPGKHGGKLRASQTFNATGLDALTKIGRRDLWINEQKMFEFAMSPNYENLCSDYICLDGQAIKSLAPAAVSRIAFAERPCKWYFVEIVNDEVEDVEEESDLRLPQALAARVSGGEQCPSAGYYFTPARTDSRRFFRSGEVLPLFESQYGKTIWQWDERQD